MKLFSHNETNLLCQSGENPCIKPLLTKRKGTQVSYQYLRSNMVRMTSTRFAFLPLAKIKVRLGQALGGNSPLDCCI